MFYFALWLTVCERDKPRPLQNPQNSKGTTGEIQPLDVNFNRQYKKLFKRISEEALYKGLIDGVTNRACLMNIHSLIWNQFSARAYRDMIRHAWHNTDSDYSVTEIASRPPGRMVQEIQFDFDHDENFSTQAGVRSMHS